MGSADFCISIHALRVEGDNQNDKLHELHQISIHALRVEGDLATPIETPLPPAISIHALRVEGDHLFSDCSLSIRISIHALRVEGDIDDNPTLDAAFVISIHALRVEGDTEHFNIAIFVAVQFLSTPSGWRATRLTHPHGTLTQEFLSTPSGWRATPYPIFSGTVWLFLSTPSGWRATMQHTASTFANLDFYPRPPGGGRPVCQS